MWFSKMVHWSPVSPSNDAVRLNSITVQLLLNWKPKHVAASTNPRAIEKGQLPFPLWSYFWENPIFPATTLCFSALKWPHHQTESVPSALNQCLHQKEKPTILLSWWRDDLTKVYVGLCSQQVTTGSHTLVSQTQNWNWRKFTVERIYVTGHIYALLSIYITKGNKEDMTTFYW